MLKTFTRSSLRFTTNRSSSPTSSSSQFSKFRPSFPSLSTGGAYSSRNHYHSSRLLGTFVLSVAPPIVAISALAFTDELEAEGQEGINRKDSHSPPAASILSSTYSLWPSSKTSAKPLPEEEEEHIPKIMSPPLPGRPGSLTSEEEAKLKELWAATLVVFGVTSPESSAPASPQNPSTPVPEVVEPKTPVSPDSQKKKKPLGRFLSRRGKPEKETSEKIANDVAAVVDTSDDKYGQTKEFKAALASQTPAELREAFWGMVKCDNPDGLLLRFLRARKWDVDKALVMMVATMNWRSKEMDVQEVISKGEASYAASSDTGFIKQLRMGKSFLHGTDKEGRPICLVRVRLHKQADQSEEALEKYTVYIMETARLMLRDPVDTAAVVFDMSGFSMANMDYAPVKYLIKCFEAHYPESLGICLVHKAPWIFQSIWSIIRGWLDPVVASKIHFTKTIEDMEAYIDRSNIIKDLGGDDDWEYSYIEPVPGENDKMEKGSGVREALQLKRDEQIKGYEELTKRWVKGEEMKGEREKVAEGLRSGYWELDPYLRARTVYDRTGVFGEGGKFGMYGYRNKGKGKYVETSPDDID